MPHSPIIKIIDLKEARKNEKTFTVFTQTARAFITEGEKNKKQILIFINRKGTATSIICQDCGYVFKCPYCDIPLTFHKSPSQNYLLCHHCNYQEKAPLTCPQCKGHRLLPLGIGTERIKEELEQILLHYLEKSINIAIIEGEMNDAKELEILEKFAQKKINILIGTEALLKPQLKSADIIIIPSLDPLLLFPDFQSEERVWHILRQLKNITKETLIIQTYLPQHKLFSSLENNSLLFLKEELKWRQKHSWPPYAQLIRLEFKHHHLETAHKQALYLKQRLTQVIQQVIPSRLQSHFIILGPSPAFIPKEKGYYRFNLFLKFLPQQKVNIKTELLSFGLKNLSPLFNSQELKLRNKILLAVPPQWKIEVNPKDTL